MKFSNVALGGLTLYLDAFRGTGSQWSAGGVQRSAAGGREHPWRQSAQDHPEACAEKENAGQPRSACGTGPPWCVIWACSQLKDKHVNADGAQQLCVSKCATRTEAILRDHAVMQFSHSKVCVATTIMGGTAASSLQQPCKLCCCALSSLLWHRGWTWCEHDGSAEPAD